MPPEPSGTRRPSPLWTTRTARSGRRRPGRSAPAGRRRRPRAPPPSTRRHRADAATGTAAASSSSARSPLRASRLPPGATRGRHQPASRSSGATARAVTVGAVQLPCRSSARDRTTSTLDRPSSADHLGEKGGPPEQRLHQPDGQLRPQDGQRDPRQAGAGPDVGHQTGRRERAGGGGRVQQVPVPQPVRLPRADQPAGDAGRASAGRRTPRRAAASVPKTASAVSRETSIPGVPDRRSEPIRPAARRRAGSAPRPRTRWSARRPRPRRARSSARTGSSARGGSSRRWS